MLKRFMLCSLGLLLSLSLCSNQSKTVLIDEKPKLLEETSVKLKLDNKEELLLELTDVEFISMKNNETNWYEANLSNIYSNKVNVLECLLFDNEKDFLEITYCEKNQDKIVNDRYEILSQDITNKIIEDAVILNEINEDIIARQRSYLFQLQNDFYLFKKGLNGKNVLEENATRIKQKTSTDIFLDAFDPENGNDVFRLLPKNVFMVTDKISYFGKEFGFYIKSLESSTSNNIFTNKGIFALVNIETRIPNAGIGNNGELLYRIENPLIYKFTYTYDFNTNSANILFNEKLEKYFLTNFKFVCQIENENELNFGDTNYNVDEDYGDYLTGVSYEYNACSPLRWDENEYPIYDIATTAISAVTFIAGAVFPPLELFCDAIDLILLGLDIYKIAEESIEVSKSNEPYREKISFVNNNCHKTLAAKNEQLYLYGCMLRTIAGQPTYDDNSMPALYGEENWVEFKPTVMSDAYNLNGSSEMHLYFGFSCDLVEDISTKNKYELRKIDTLSTITDFDTYQSNKKMYDLDRNFKIADSIQLKPNETRRFALVGLNNKLNYFNFNLRGSKFRAKVLGYETSDFSSQPKKTVFDYIVEEELTCGASFTFNIPNELTYGLEITNLANESDFIDLEIRYPGEEITRTDQVNLSSITLNHKVESDNLSILSFGILINLLDLNSYEFNDIQKSNINITPDKRVDFKIYDNNVKLENEGSDNGYYDSIIYNEKYTFDLKDYSNNRIRMPLGLRFNVSRLTTEVSIEISIDTIINNLNYVPTMNIDDLILI